MCITTIIIQTQFWRLLRQKTRVAGKKRKTLRGEYKPNQSFKSGIKAGHFNGRPMLSSLCNFLMIITTHSMRWPTNNILMLNKGFIENLLTQKCLASTSYLLAISILIYIICTQWVKEKIKSTNQNKQRPKKIEYQRKVFSSTAVCQPFQQENQRLCSSI